jgi:hypothetical protein
MSSLLVFNRVYDWRYSQSCWYFQPLLQTSAPLTFSVSLVDSVKQRGPQTDTHLPPIAKKRRSLGFDVFIVICSTYLMIRAGSRWPDQLEGPALQPVDKRVKRRGCHAHPLQQTHQAAQQHLQQLVGLFRLQAPAPFGSMKDDFR